MKKAGVVQYQIDDVLIQETLQHALSSTGNSKLNYYKKLRFLKLHKGKWLVKLVNRDV